MRTQYSGCLLSYLARIFRFHLKILMKMIRDVLMIFFWAVTSATGDLPSDQKLCNGRVHWHCYRPKYYFPAFGIHTNVVLWDSWGDVWVIPKDGKHDHKSIGLFNILNHGSTQKGIIRLMIVDLRGFNISTFEPLEAHCPFCVLSMPRVRMTREQWLNFLMRISEERICLSCWWPQLQAFLSEWGSQKENQHNIFK